MVSFEAQKFLIFVKSNLPFFLVSCAFSVIPKKALPNPKAQRFILTFSSKSLIALALTFRSIISLS